MNSRIKLGLITLIYAFLLRIFLAFILPITLFSVGFLYDGVLLVTLILLIALIPSIFMQKVLHSFFMLFFAILSVINIVYFQYFKTLVTKVNIQGLVFLNPRVMLDEYAISLDTTSVIIFIIVIVFLALYFKQFKKPDILSFKMKWVAVVWLVLCIITFAFVLVKEKSESLHYYQSTAFYYNAEHDRIALANNMGYFSYHVFDLLRMPTRNTMLVSEGDSLFHSINSHENNADTASFLGSNLLTITVESFDSRFIHETLTPTLFRLQEEGYQFPNFYVPTFQQGVTCNSEYMAFTGLYASHSTVDSNTMCHGYKDNTYSHSLPNQLSSLGYHNYYFHSGYSAFYNRHTVMPNIGFDFTYFKEDILERDTEHFNDRFDTNINTMIASFMDFSEPFYMHVLTYGMHGAYNQDDYPYGELIDNALPLVDNEVFVYYQKLIEFDRFLESLIDLLKQNNVYDNTLIAIYTDHYPYMMNTDTYHDYLSINKESLDRYKQTLMLYHPSMEAKTFEHLGSLVDIAPTLLNLLTSEADYTRFFGQDLLSNLDNEVLFYDYSVLTNTQYITLKDEVFTPQEEAILIEMITRYQAHRKLLNADYYRNP